MIELELIIKRRSKYASVLAGLLLSALLSFASAEDNPVVLLSPTVLRAMATTTTLPEFPRESVAHKHSGVAVAEATVGPDGNVRSVQILQQPDQAIGAAVTTAIMRWKFRSFVATGGAAMTVKSRVIFYFRLGGKSPEVIDAVATKPSTHH